MSILFINASPNKDGNTAKLAKTLLAGKEYETLNLIDYKIYAYGQNYADDQFEEIIEKMKRLTPSISPRWAEEETRQTVQCCRAALRSTSCRMARSSSRLG